MATLDKKFDILSNLYVLTDSTGTFGNTTLSAAATKGASTFSGTAGTNFANGDDIRIGSGETLEVARVTNVSGPGPATFTLSKPLKFDHASGEPVVEQQAFNLGAPEADGFRLSYNGETTDVFSAVSRMAYGVLTGFVDLGASWRWPTVTVDTIATALGIPRSNILGDGTAAAQTGTVGPRLFTTDGALFGTARNMSVIATGSLQDGSYFKLDLYNTTFDPTAFSVTLARGQLATVPARCMASSGAADFTNSAFTPSTVVNTYAASKADIFSEITGVSYLTNSGTSSTTTGVAAGAYSVTVASASGFTAGGIIKIGTGDLAEYHYIHGIVSNALNLRTQVLRAHGSATPVAQQTQNALGVAVGGVTLAASGSVETQRSELSRTSLAYRAQNVALTVSLNIDAIKPESLYLALGIDSGEYASSVLPLNANIGKASSQTLMFTGLTQGGKTITVVGWNGSAQIGGETQFTQAATALVPLAFKPNGLNVWANA